MRPLVFAVAMMIAGAAQAQQQAPDPATADLLARFLAERGEGIEACFTDMPQMQDNQRGARFRAADDAPPPPLRRLVVAVDASGSMAGGLGGGTKMAAAKRAVVALLDGLPDDVTTSLVAFGHQGTNDDTGRTASCAGVQTLVPGTTARDGLRAAVDGLQPAGWTPLAGALAAAGAELSPSDTSGEQVVYVVSDGEETCGGDPVAQARALHQGEIHAVINILGLDLPDAERAQLEAVAKAGGGVFTPIATQSELSRSIDEMRRDNANNLEMLRSDNHAAITQLRNDNASAGALLRLDNCVAGGALREGNRVRNWARDQGLTADQQTALRAALTGGHDAYSARAAGIRSALESARDAANATVQDKLDQTRSGFEAVR